MTTKDKLRQDILDLLSGKKKPYEINKRLEIHFASDGDTIITRLINGRQVSEEDFDAALKVAPVPGTIATIKTVGRKDDDEEFYY